VTASRHAAIVLAHDSGLRLFDAGHLARLAEIGELLNTDPIDDWREAGAAALLERCTVLCTHWGCPPIDKAVVDAAPGLSLIAHAAGSVKHIVGRAVWERGIRVTSGAAANAEPVAQFTLAAILFAGKGVPWRANATDPTDPALRSASTARSAITTRPSGSSVRH
jgi:phosphoglycerate dehydrogenase-like enzyme